jgi:hypothetical protein
MLAMNRNFLRRGCLIVLGLTVLLLAAAGAWWLLRPKDQLTEAPPPSPVLVFLISPASGDEFTVGDYLPVVVQMIAPEDIVSAELFVDGQSVGVANDPAEDALWTWQAWPAGIHTLSARATAADGQVGESQTVIVNVLAGGGFIPVSAEEGQTLEQIGASYGVAPDVIAAANPHVVDPAQPLQGGFPVRVPGDGGSGSESGEGGGEQVQSEKMSPIPHITWQFTPTADVDKSYCYLSAGGGQWEKIPKKPFHFFNGPQTYVQYDISTGGEASLPAVQAQCWGWQGGALKYLGQGETKFDADQPPNPLVVTGQGFELVGMPQMKTMGGGGLPPDDFPPPHSLRPPINAEDCASHFPNPLARLFVAWLCDELLNDGQDRVLQWEWQSGCWLGQEGCIQHIDGYLLYVIYKNDPEPSTHYLREINNPEQKVAAFPLPWGITCYGVAAYVEDAQSGGKNFSDMATYCPGGDARVFSLTPVKMAKLWKTVGEIDESGSDCKMMGSREGMNQPISSIFVSRRTYVEDTDPDTELSCGHWDTTIERGLVQFSFSQLVDNGVSPEEIVSTTLEYDAYYEWWGHDFLDIYGSTKKEAKDSVGSIHIVNEPWLPYHFNIASQPMINVPMSTVWMITTTRFSFPINPRLVRDWMSGAQPNYGLLFVGRDESLSPPKSTGYQRAWITNLVLKVQVVKQK